MKCAPQRKPERHCHEAWFSKIWVLTCLCFAVLPHPGISAELKPGTVKAWEQYIGWIDARVTRELANADLFLTQDRMATPQRLKLVDQLNAGQVYVEQMKVTAPGDVDFEVPDGLIHHWWGSILVPRIKLPDLLEFLQDYDHFSGRFSDVEASKLLSRQGNFFKIYLRLRRTKVFVTAYYNTTQDCAYFVHDPKRASSRSISTRIAEIENPGTSEEREKPPGKDRGFLWGLASWWRFRETGAGVVVEVESISLSRNIPTLINLIPGAAGYIRATPRDSLASILTSIRTQAGR